MPFNKEQQALIDSPIDQKTVGVSGAGTGKTTTILARTKRLLNEYSTGRILLITFTRNSAKDMRDRLYRQLDERQARRVTVGTFHSVIGKLIRDNAVAVGLQPTFSVIDENSSNTMYRSIVEENAEYQQVAIQWFADEIKGDKLLKKHYKKISGAVSTLINTSSPTELMTGEFSEQTLYFMTKIDENIGIDEVKMLHSVFKDSLAKGRETNTVTYDHILFIGYLMCRSGMMDNFAKGLIHMMVDEYQDTNLLQDEFVRTVGKNNLTLIGDVDQAIYGFRGGKAELLEKHAKDGIVINLTTNYRSYQPILDSANSIIDNNLTGKSIRKPLNAALDTDEHYAGILVTHADQDRKESEWVINKIKYLIRNGVKEKDIAILVRSRMAMTSINLELTRQNLPVNDTTKFADFMNSDVMVDTLNFIKMYTNPKDIYAFLAVLDRPKRNIGPVALKKLETAARSHNMGIIEFILSPHVDELTPALKKNVQGFVDVYTKVTSQNNTQTFPEMVKYLLKETGYIDWVNGLKTKDKHLRNIVTLENVIEDFVEEYSEWHKDFTLFDIANAFTFEMTSAVRQDDNDGICIATIHGAKGLEWDYVFISGMEDELFPGGKIMDNEDMESERRLMYVAVTRAKKGLTLCQSDSRIVFQDRKLTPSIFLEEGEFVNEMNI